MTAAGGCSGVTGSNTGDSGDGGGNTDTGNTADDGGPSCAASDLATWDAHTIYTGKDLIAWNDTIWRAGWWTLSEEPGTTGEWGVWRLADANDCDIDGTDDGGTDSAGTDNSGTDDGSADNDSSGTTIALSDLQAKEAELTSGESMSLVKDAIATRDNSVVDAITPEAVTNPVNVKRVESIMSAADWDYLFPRRAPEYTYTNFLKAVGKGCGGKTGLILWCWTQAEFQFATATFSPVRL